MWSNLAYFSTWWPYGNQVSRTRFTILINIEKNPKHIRENPEKKKKNQKNLEHQRNPGSARPRSLATWVTCCLGFFHPSRVQPKPHATWAMRYLGFFHPSRVQPRPCATQAARGPGYALPRPQATQAVCCLGFFHPRSSHIISGWWSGIKSVQHGSESLDSFSPMIRLLWLWISYFFIFLFFWCISACTRDLKFF